MSALRRQRVVAILVASTMWCSRAVAGDAAPTEADIMVLPHKVHVFTVTAAGAEGEPARGRVTWPIVAYYVRTVNVRQPDAYDLALTCDTEADAKCDRGEKKLTAAMGPFCWDAKARRAHWVTAGLGCQIDSSAAFADVQIIGQVVRDAQIFIAKARAGLSPAEKAEHDAAMAPARRRFKKQ